LSDFDLAPLGTNEYWNGSDRHGGHLEGGAFFENHYDALYDSWAGFSLSRVNSTNTPGYANQYAVFSGAGVGGTGIYATVYDSAWDEADIVTLPTPSSALGFYVNNTTYAALAMRDGDAFSKKFGGATGNDPDWFLLTITGRDEAGTSLGNVAFYLADYRFATNSQDYIVEDWTWVDLTSLGPDVKTLHFTLSSTDNGMFGMNTPAYFAMDEFRFVPSFSGPATSTNPWDAAIPGYVGSLGNGLTNAPNTVNPVFAGWASSVRQYAPAPGVAAQWTNASLALGHATGNNFDIVSLGDLDQTQIDGGTPAGQVILAFDIRISDGEGPDLAVFENGFVSGGPNDLLGELGYVEVSSDGTNFARFPAASWTTNFVATYDPIDGRNVYNLCGKHVNAYGFSWGTPFDLADLACHPLVTVGTLCLTNVQYVRVVDIPGNGDFVDGCVPSNPVYDPWVTSGSGGVDLEAIGVINSPDYRHIRVSAGTYGTITPCGVPDGRVAVSRGGNRTFQITPLTDHVILDVTVDGVSVGVTNQYTFSNVQQDHEIEASFGCTLQIESVHGVATPVAGNHDLPPGLIACSVSSPVVSGTTQYVCRGWVGTGSVPTGGTAAATGSFNLTNSSSVTWLWTTNYRFAVDTSRGGSADRGDAWAPSGEVATSTATAHQWYEFRGWSGDTAGDTNNTVMVITMTGAKSIHANFYADTTSNHTPVAWLAYYHLTNGTADAESELDRDGDGYTAREEFLAGTDPSLSNSVFMIVDHGFAGGSNYVSWTGGTNGSGLPYSILVRSNLTVGWTTAGWCNIRSASGTNTWWAAGATPRAFYRIQVTDEE